MQAFITLAGIIGALAVGVVNPGPSFVLVARVAVSASRANGVAAALGTGLGGVTLYASVFAAFLPATFSLPFAVILLCVVFAVEAAWYAVVAVLLSSSQSRRAYLSCKAWVDRTAGLVMMGLGLKLITSVHQ
jgi:threonine/homoserine/homoserine lactone efflux protein